MGSFITKKLSQVVELADPVSWFVCGNGSYAQYNVQPCNDSPKNDVFIIEPGTWARPSGDQELYIVVICAELDLVVVVVLRQTQRHEARPGVGEREGLGIDRLGVEGEVGGRRNLPPVAASLATGEEEVAGEDFVDQSAPVGGPGSAGAHSLEVGDSVGEEAAVEAEDNAAERLSIRAGEEDVTAGAGGGLGGPFGDEGGGTEGEVEEDLVGNFRLQGWWSRGGRKGEGKSGGGGGEE